jgi:hypothetical protein
MGDNKMCTNQKNILAMNEHFELREKLIGFALQIPSMINFNVDEDEYKKEYERIYNELSELKKEAFKNTKDFNVVVRYKTNDSVFIYETTVTERTKEEAIERVKRRTYFNLITGRKIKNPKFLEICIN